MKCSFLAICAALALFAAGCQDGTPGEPQTISCSESVTKTLKYQRQVIHRQVHPYDVRSEVKGLIMQQVEALFAGVECPTACKERVIQMDVKKLSVEFTPSSLSFPNPRNGQYLLDVDVDIEATLRCKTAPAEGEIIGEPVPTPFEGDPTGSTFNRTPTPAPTAGVTVVFPGSTAPTPTPYPTVVRGACGNCLIEQDAGREDYICPFGENAACETTAKQLAQSKRLQMIGQASSAGVICNFNRCPDAHVSYSLLPTTVSHRARIFTDPQTGQSNRFWVYTAIAPYELRKYCLGPEQSLK